MTDASDRTMLRTVHMAVRDLDDAVAFYGDAMGLEVHREGDDRVAIVRLGGGVRLMLDEALGEQLTVTPHRSAGAPHAHFHLEVSDAATLKSRLQACGHPIESAENPTAGLDIFLTCDPDGHNLEIYSR